MNQVGTHNLLENASDKLGGTNGKRTYETVSFMLSAVSPESLGENAVKDGVEAVQNGDQVVRNLQPAIADAGTGSTWAANTSRFDTMKWIGKASNGEKAGQEVSQTSNSKQTLGSLEQDVEKLDNEWNHSNPEGKSPIVGGSQAQVTMTVVQGTDNFKVVDGLSKVSEKTSILKDIEGFSVESKAVNEVGNAQRNAILQTNKVTALQAYQQQIANGNQILAQASGEEDLANSIPVGQASSTDVISSAKGTGQAGTRPTWRQSEQDASSDYPGYQTQQSFKDGSPVSNGTKGSSRPDLYTDGHSIEVKNYDVTTSQGRNNLINNVAGQVIKRKTDLPEGTRQTVQIDVRGQNVSREYLIQVRDGIVRKTDNGAEVIFKMN